MRLLVITQEIDSKSATLGFFHEWVEELSKRYDSIEVICLYAGTYTLPENVRVHSLGKERGETRIGYIRALYTYVWKLRRDYDAVFVHMNQEYILLAGWLWKLLGKPVYMWRNHYKGSWLTDIAAFFCKKIFYTSIYSYTAKYAQSVRMPIGVPKALFSVQSDVLRKPRSILFLARIAPSKNPDLLIEALGILHARGVSFSASLYGFVAEQDRAYYERLLSRVTELDLESVVHFYDGVSHAETAPVYRAHQIFVNCSRSGMYDKTIFEAALSGCDVLAASEDWKQLAGEKQWFSLDVDTLVSALEEHLHTGAPELVQIAEDQTLEVLTQRIKQEVVA